MFEDPLAGRARKSPTHVAVIDRGSPGARLTWAQLDATATLSARRLTSAGVTAGDPVAVTEPAGARFAALLHACIRIGAVAVPMSPRVPDAERGRLIDLVRPIAAMGDLDVIFTSGTTGEPKPVRQTLSNHRASADGCVESLGRVPGDSWLAVLQPHHVGGFAIFMRSVLHDQPVVTLPGFDESEVIAALDEENPTLVSLVPAMITRIVDAGGVAALRRPRAILVGGAPATPDQIRQWVELGLNVCPTYGMTETCSQIATVPPGRALELLGTAGFVHSQARVTFEGGVIAVSGPVVSPGFDGRVVTGDVGHFDERGALVVVGRRDDVIITGGEKVHPTEVEDVLREHPGVRDVAVVGRPDRVYGQALEALIVGEGVTASDIVAWSRERLPSHKVPRLVRFVERLPRSEGGKLRRREL
jgi:O-succinylbenzoic acid--CoA ligase